MKDKIIFLNFNGVLNGFGKFKTIFFLFMEKLHLMKFIKKHHDDFEVDTRKIKRLLKIIRKTGAKVVLCNIDRKDYYRAYSETSVKSAYDKLRKYNIPVIGITPYLNQQDRVKEIKTWIDINMDKVDRFIILDDEFNPYKKYYEDMYFNMITSGNQEEINKLLIRTGKDFDGDTISEYEIRAHGRCLSYLYFKDHIIITKDKNKPGLTNKHVKRAITLLNESTNRRIDIL